MLSPPFIMTEKDRAKNIIMSRKQNTSITKNRMTNSHKFNSLRQAKTKANATHRCSACLQGIEQNQATPPVCKYVLSKRLRAEKTAYFATLLMKMDENRSIAIKNEKKTHVQHKIMFTINRIVSHRIESDPFSFDVKSTRNKKKTK